MATGFSFGGPSSFPAGAFQAKSAAGEPLSSLSVLAGAPPSSFSTHPFQYIQECFDASSANYRFRYFFYNVIPGGVLANPQARPANVSDRLWTQVSNDNPDPSKMAPVLANGFADLTARRAWQDDSQSAQRAKLQELEQRVTSLLMRQDLDVTTQIQVIQKQQLRLTLRIFQLMRKVEVMRRAGTKISAQEQAMLGRIQLVVAHLNQPPLSRGTVRHLEEQLQTLLDAGRLDPFASARLCHLHDDESQRTLQTILEQQQKGIAVLVDAVHRDMRDLDTIRYGYLS